MEVRMRFSLSRKMSRLARDGTAEPVSRDQILRHERGQGKIIFPVQLITSRIGNLRVVTNENQYFEIQNLEILEFWNWQNYPVDPYPCYNI